MLTFEEGIRAVGARPTLAFPNPNAAAMLSEAAQCAMPHGCGCYLVGVENGEPRGLTDQEEQIVNRFRFGRDNEELTSCHRCDSVPDAIRGT